MCSQKCDFLHRLLKRVVKWSNLPAESDWEKLCSLELAVEELLCIPEFIQKTEFRAKALKVPKSRIDVWRDRGKKAKTDVVVRNVKGKTFNPFLDQRRQFIRFVAKQILTYPSFKSDLVISMAPLITCCLFCRKLKPSIVIVIISRVLLHVVDWIVSSVMSMWMIMWNLWTIPDTFNWMSWNVGRLLRTWYRCCRPVLNYLDESFRVICSGSVVDVSVTLSQMCPKLNSALVGLAWQMWIYPASYSHYKVFCCRLLLKRASSQIRSLVQYAWSYSRDFVTLHYNLVTIFGRLWIRMNTRKHMQSRQNRT